MSKVKPPEISSPGSEIRQRPGGIRVNKVRLAPGSPVTVNSLKELVAYIEKVYGERAKVQVVGRSRSVSGQGELIEIADKSSNLPRTPSAATQQATKAVPISKLLSEGLHSALAVKRRLQGHDARAAMKAAFDASPEEIGEAAVALAAKVSASKRA